MFIPDKKVSIGDYVQLTQDYRITDGMFTCGHVFRVKRYYTADKIYDLETTMV